MFSNEAMGFEIGFDGYYDLFQQLAGFMYTMMIVG
jgi:hypothetical protein